MKNWSSRSALRRFPFRFAINLAALSFALPFLHTASGSAAERPNFLVMLADDLGYGDLACYGHPEIKTPHLDRLADEGLRLTACYAAAANCSPSRTGMMTGRTPWRVGVHNWIPMLSHMHVPESEITVATLLRDGGYDTGHFGKWHLNGWFNLTGQPQPNHHGFDYWFSAQNNALPNHRDPYNFVRNSIPVGPLKGFSGPLVAGETVRWLREIRDPEKPFFAFVCFHEPHEPIATAVEHQAHYARLPDPRMRARHGNVTQMDAAAGQILGVLDELELRESTLIFFTSDNGPANTKWHPHGSSGPLRDKKGFLSDGGIRVPGILRWPGKIEAGTVSDEPVIGTDLLPTLCELASVKAPTDRKLDGASIVPVFSGQTVERKTPLYWHFYRAQGPEKAALRDGDYKIVAELSGPDFRGADLSTSESSAYRTAEITKLRLFNLKEDIGETTDLSVEQPQRFEEMKQKITNLYQEVRDESPSWPEWTFPRYEGLRIEWPNYKNIPK